jgi:hypothetical protein
LASRAVQEPAVSAIAARTGPAGRIHRACCDVCDVKCGVPAEHDSNGLAVGVLFMARIYLPNQINRGMMSVLAIPPRAGCVVTATRFTGLIEHHPCMSWEITMEFRLLYNGQLLGASRNETRASHVAPRAKAAEPNQNSLQPPPYLRQGRTRGFF